MKTRKATKGIEIGSSMRLSDMSDEALVEKTLEGSDAAFGELTKRYMQKSYSIAFQMVGDFETAQDLSQDVFLKIYKSLHKFNFKSKFFSWFYKILMNHCINYTRRRKALKFLAFSEIFQSSNNALDKNDILKYSDEETTEKQRMVRMAVDQLSPNHKQVIVMCDLEGFPQEEVADILGMAIGTVRSRLHYARGNLKKILKKYLNEI
ncbi:RNA polymerase sigma factor [candidate division KSB1 bacterium]